MTTDGGETAGLYKAWRGGLALNRAAPAAVLLRLVEAGEHIPFGLGDRELDEQELREWVVHPAWEVRRELAMCWTLSAEARAPLFLDPVARHRFAFTTLAADFSTPLTDETFRLLAEDPAERVRAAVAAHRDLPVRDLVRLAVDPDPEVRRGVVRRAWPHLAAETRTALLADPDEKVREGAVLAHHTTVPVTAADLAAIADEDLRRKVVEECRLARELAEALVRDADRHVRRALAANTGLDLDLALLLGADQENSVRWAVSVRADLTEEQRARIEAEDVPGRTWSDPLPWVRALHDDPEAMRRCAASAHVELRRSVAWARTLPQDVADRLAADEHQAVREVLVERCDQAPGELLFERWRSGGTRSTAQLLYRSNFPREYGLRHLDHPDPKLRQLAAMDPAADAEQLERLSRDSDPRVREQVLRGRRLDLASVIRLIDDPDVSVRSAAVLDPRLPEPLLDTLLQAPATAWSAAMNPSLPEAAMHRLLNTIGRDA
ncbi:PE-PGRS family protein [Kitasatospora sp. NPDC002227]|uniref:PE-PGRS family protein n=1 Tax=Kitasatospora sp. NPDC002227 TaxID=3154773 RepID=UPI0033195135